MNKRYVCEMCGYEDKDLVKTIKHEKICGIGSSNPLSVLEYKGSLTNKYLFEGGGHFKEFYEIDEKLEKFKNHGWRINRNDISSKTDWIDITEVQQINNTSKNTGSAAYGVQWSITSLLYPDFREGIFELIQNSEVVHYEEASFKKAVELAINWITSLNPEYSHEIENRKIKKIEIMKSNAKEREDALDFEKAISLWEEIGDIKEAARVRRKLASQGTVKVAQKVVHGDEVTKTEIKDSVVSKSNVNSSGDDKFARLERLAEMKEKGLIDDDEFKLMKKEIIG